MTPLKEFFIRLSGATLFAIATATAALSQNTTVIKRGDAVVSGFSGTEQAGAGGNAVDNLFIDAEGASAQILALETNAPPTAQLITGAPLLKIKARDVGQVFAVALDDGLKPFPSDGVANIYLGATSAYGLQIVAPDGGSGPKRIKRGQADAEWMAGQFGAGGGPGSIWKVNGGTGAVSLFATLPNNSGPGVGDITFDPASLHFYASDLDTGLIHRIDSAGNLIDTFDHGLRGREEAGLETVADNGIGADIRKADFNSLDPITWGFTQPERRVWALSVNGGRLYYSVDDGPSIWSVSINLDGSFGSDARREFEVSGTPRNHQISDIAFDAQGFMYVAQRGGVRGTYDYASMAEGKNAVVFRYKREIPDDPATPGIWVPVPDEVAIGFPPDHRNTSGGLALGYGYDEAGRLRAGQCDAMLWSTGDNLRAGAEGAGDAIVHGLQGSDRMLVRPDNEPPLKSYFLDYDGRSDDADKTGQVGDVEIWQPCDKDVRFGSYAPMPYLPPEYVPPSYYPPGYVPPGGGSAWDFNLLVDKEAVPFACAPGGLGFLCTYTVRVTNTGPDPYIGPVVINDSLPAAPAGAVMTFANQPPWMCVQISPSQHECTYDPAVLWPGNSIDLKVTVDTPVPAPMCHLDNMASITWPLGFGDANPGDDFDLATAGIPAAHCPPVAGEKTNLELSKYTWKPVCADKFGHFECEYVVVVRNAGGAVYNGSIKIDEEIPAGTTATFSASPQWTCQAAAPYSCEHAPVVLAPNQSRFFGVTVKVPKDLADDLGCKATNKAKIVHAPGGSDLNTDATDDEAAATATVPGTLAQCPGLALSNLKISKTNVTNGKCPVSGSNWECKFKIKVTNFGATYTSEVQILDALPIGSPAGTTVDFQAPAGWSCSGPVIFPTLYQCKSTNPNLAAGQSAEIGVTVKIPAPSGQCSIKNTASIIKAPGGTLINAFAGDDKSSATAQFAPVLKGNMFYCLAPSKGGPKEPPLTAPEKQDTNLSISKTAGASVKTTTGQNTPFVITVTNTGPGVYSGPIEVRETLPVEPSNGSWQAPWVCEGQSAAGHPEQGLCAHPEVQLQPGESVVLNMEMEMPDSYVAPSGSNVTCGYTNQVEITQAAGGTPPNTNAGDDAATAEVKFAPFEKHGKTFCGIDDITTPPPPPPPATCPQGWSHTPLAGKCCPPRTRWNGKRCERGSPPDTCKPKSCDRDETWDGESCSCIEKECPEGTAGKYPSCKPEECPAGFSGTPPNCTRRISDPPRDTCKRRQCDSGKVWDSEGCACVHKTCPAGTVGEYPRCKAKECPEGTRGEYPNCKTVPEGCRPGFTGTPPNCKRIADPDPPKCPDGFSGKPPRCKRIPPPQCPTGMKGTPPNCKRIVEPPSKCPPGMAGKPPHCRVIPKPCPPGFRGRQPNCKPIAVPRLNRPASFRPAGTRPTGPRPGQFGPRPMLSR